MTLNSIPWDCSSTTGLFLMRFSDLSSDEAENELEVFRLLSAWPRDPGHASPWFTLVRPSGKSKHHIRFWAIDIFCVYNPQ